MTWQAENRKKAIDWSNKIFPATYHDDWCGDFRVKNADPP